MKKWLILLFLVVLISGGCTPKQQIANPASVYCEEQGGALEIKTADDGSQVGYCVFSTGKLCEEWAFYRKECTKEVAVAEPETPTTPAKTYDLFIKNVVRDDTSATCSIVSKLTNLDSVNHKYSIKSNILLDEIEADSTEDIIILNAGQFRMTSHSFECPDRMTYKLDTLVSQI